MSLTTHSMYQKHILRCLNFSPAALPFGQLWRDPAAAETGFCYIFERPGAYILSVADYPIPRPFSLAFRSHRPTLRFGSLYEGATHYQLDGCRAGSSSPVHFLVREQGIRGKQSWQRGDHCRGIELALSQPYLDSLKPLAAQLSLLDRLPANVTQNVLPPAVVTLLREMAALADTQTLSPLRLEGMVLQCLGELAEAAAEIYFSPQDRPLTLVLGKRRLSFSAADHQAIHQACRLITEHPEVNHTIASLSRQVYLNEQKLKAGFAFCYHTTIGAYLKDCRMARAAELLVNTNLSVHDIAHACGYGSNAGFSKAFRQKYALTPLRFRSQKRADDRR